MTSFLTSYLIPPNTSFQNSNQVKTGVRTFQSLMNSREFSFWSKTVTPVNVLIVVSKKAVGIDLLQKGWLGYISIIFKWFGPSQPLLDFNEICQLVNMSTLKASMLFFLQVRHSCPWVLDSEVSSWPPSSQTSRKFPMWL